MSNADIIRSAYEAFARLDIPNVLAAMSDDITWTAPTSLPSGGVFVGKEALVGFFQNLPSHFDEIAVVPESFFEVGDHVIVRGHHRMRIGNERLEVPFAMFWRMKNGKAVEQFEFNDSALIARAFDLRAAQVG